MARLPALIELLASFGGAERKTLELQARTLREAGLLSPSKRGVGATPVTVEDAAVLLLAHMATDSAASAPEIVQRYAGLTNYLYDDPEYDRLQPRHSRASLIFWPIYSARTSLDALKMMIYNADKFWNFCQDPKPPRAQEKALSFANLAALGEKHRALDARRASVSLDRVGRSLAVTINDVYEHKWSYKPYYIADYDKDGLFEHSMFSHSWIDTSLYNNDEDPLETKVVKISGRALLKINELLQTQ